MRFLILYITLHSIYNIKRTHTIEKQLLCVLVLWLLGCINLWLLLRVVIQLCSAICLLVIVFSSCSILIGSFVPVGLSLICSFHFGNLSVWYYTTFWERCQVFFGKLFILFCKSLICSFGLLHMVGMTNA